MLGVVAWVRLETTNCDHFSTGDELRSVQEWAVGTSHLFQAAVSVSIPSVPIWLEKEVKIKHTNSKCGKTVFHVTVT